MPRRKGEWQTPILDRALAKTVRDPETGCWEWLGSKSPGGYGQIRAPGNDGQLLTAHRVLYEHFVGPIPADLMMDHFVCDNRGCVSPWHVRPVSRRENNLRCERSVAAVNRAKTECLRGHPLDGENAEVDRQGRRRCLACQRLRNRARYDSAARALMEVLAA